jgi:hypothetical protein
MSSLHFLSRRPRLALTGTHRRRSKIFEISYCRNWCQRFAKKSLLLLLVAPDLEQLLFKSDVILSWSLTRFQMEKKVKPSVPPLLSLDYKIDSLKLHRETFPPSPFSESGDFHKNSIPPKWIKPWSRRVRRSNLIQFGPRLRRNPRKQIRNDTVTARKDSCIRSGAGRDGGGPMHL